MAQPILAVLFIPPANSVRSTFTDRFGLVIYSKRTNVEAELARVEALQLEKQTIPQTEATRHVNHLTLVSECPPSAQWDVSPLLLKFNSLA